MCWRNPLPLWVSTAAWILVLFMVVLGLFGLALTPPCRCQPTVAVPLEKPVDYPSVLIHEPVRVK